MNTRRLFFASLAFAVLVFSGCPCWVPAPPHSPRRMAEVDTTGHYPLNAPAPANASAR